MFISTPDIVVLEGDIKSPAPSVISSQTILGEWWQRMEGTGDVAYRVTVESNGACTLKTGDKQIGGRWEFTREGLVFVWENGVTCRFLMGILK